jgi:xylulokinase
MSYIGLDVGLSGCKACLFSERDGRLLASAYREYAMECPRPGWAELDPALVWRCVREALGALASGAAEPPRALCVSSHGESAVPVDREGRDLARAITPVDRRITDLPGIMAGGLPVPEVVRITGQPPHPMYTLPRMLWLRRHAPEVVARAWKFLCFQEYILFRLGAREPVTSHSQAARTWAFDVYRREWSRAVLDSHGFGPELFARAAPAATVAGEIDPAVAEELRLPRGLKLLTGGHDQACGALGVAVLRAGLAVDSTGTVECITPTFSRPLAPEVVMQYNLCNSPHVVDGLFVTFAWNVTGGSLLKWYRDKIATYESRALAEQGRDFYAERLVDLPVGPSGLLALPHFAGSGTPWYWQDSYGAVLGLDFDTDRQRLLKGLIEGVTYEMKYNLAIMQKSGLRVDRFVAVGGGARSEEWLQVKANIFGLPVTRTKVTEGACLGCAMMCAHALEGASYDALSLEWIRPDRVFEPQPAFAARYAEYFGLYCKMVEALRPVQSALHALRTR